MSYGQYSTAPKVSKPSLPRTRKRLRHVFADPSHVWAHPREKDGSGFEQTEAWNSQKNFYFKTAEDGTRILYSYRDTYPVAARFVHNKKPVFLVRSGKPYSVTTSMHTNMAGGAVPHSAIRFDVPCVASEENFFRIQKPSAKTHKANLADIIERISEAIGKFNKAHSLWSINYSQNDARRLTREARTYARFFNVRLPKLPAIPELSKERREKARLFDASLEDRRNRRDAARQARWEARQKEWSMSQEERLTTWRNGGNLYHGIRTEDGFALLRVKRSNVETSQGVSVPISGLTGAARLLRFLTALKESGRTYQRNGHTEHIGNFTVESFDGETLIAGCHRVKWQEIASISDAVRSADKTKPELVA